MTADEIQKQMNDERRAFSMEKYRGHISIPPNIIELFKKAIFALPPFAHKISSIKVKAIASQEISQLTNDDLNDIIKVVVNTPHDKLYSSFDEAIESNIKIEKFVLSYNIHISEFDNRLQAKMKTLENLSSGVAPRLNGMRIIPPSNQY